MRRMNEKGRKNGKEREKRGLKRKCVCLVMRKRRKGEKYLCLMVRRSRLRKIMSNDEKNELKSKKEWERAREKIEQKMCLFSDEKRRKGEKYLCLMVNKSKIMRKI